MRRGWRKGRRGWMRGGEVSEGFKVVRLRIFYMSSSCAVEDGGSAERLQQHGERLEVLAVVAERAVMVEIDPTRRVEMSPPRWP